MPLPPRDEDADDDEACKGRAQRTCCTTVTTLRMLFYVVVHQIDRGRLNYKFEPTSIEYIFYCPCQIDTYRVGHLKCFSKWKQDLN